MFGMLLQIEDDAYQEDLGFSLGQLGKSGSGRVRQAQVNEATKARISKSLQVMRLSESGLNLFLSSFGSPFCLFLQ